MNLTVEQKEYIRQNYKEKSQTQLSVELNVHRSEIKRFLEEELNATYTNTNAWSYEGWRC